MAIAHFHMLISKKIPTKNEREEKKLRGRYPINGEKSLGKNNLQSHKEIAKLVLKSLAKKYSMTVSNI